MKIENAFQAISLVFLDTAPVIYYVEATDDKALKKVTELRILVLDDLEF